MERRCSFLGFVLGFLLVTSQLVSARPATKRELLQDPGPSYDSSGLDFNYYATSCPKAQQIVADTVSSYAAQSPPGRVTAALLRLIFHDCFVGGCDGSVLIDSTANNSGEKDAVGNLSMDPLMFEIVDGIKVALEAACPGTVTCADIVALGGREAVYQAGGQYFEMPLGRLDSNVSSVAEANAELPGPFSTADQLINQFAAKGLTQQDLVVLSGAHSLGTAHCFSLADRLVPSLGLGGSAFPPGQLQQLVQQACNDGILQQCFNNTQFRQCLTAGVVSLLGDNGQVPDLQFSSIYYQRLTQGLGMLTSDVVLFEDPRTQGIVQEFAQSQDIWFTTFSASLLDMSRIGVQLAPSDSYVRTNCRVVGS